ncbi:hypothetical protein G6F46_005517 [Rhizopus delemar]|uniref:Uncharacterized protein n=2 Tax=Rhizopus TaxID=4842 RepID=A0A9P7CQ15_9FUNG|nr:hypothetical protein G6F55_004841 [Rhizopus delemar]KAG1545113.1 hypothetical protein G6F51_005662 [Rhizopus arrhizus]KAG1497733.1 hypothetical protein G6F54_005570 [Rhizopus delemar]KAG1512437.1 hypothetical protein G6F53_005192 [Rhizopus delemar]KAG1526728.1 hypothetical protein G6F52_002167 [Rhizopus delemar]
MGGSKRGKRILRKEGERYDERSIVSTVKWGGGGAMYRPAQSPDLNPVEHVWNALERQIERKRLSVKNLQQLKVALQKECVRPDNEFADRFVRSTKRRYEAIIKAKTDAYLKVYISSSYGETDFGDVDDQSAPMVDKNIDMTAVLRKFREECVKGAWMRKSLSVRRTLALSFIFLISSNHSSLLSKMSPGEMTSIMKDLDVKKSLKAALNLSSGLTYRMTFYCSDGQLMIPDFVVYVDPISTIKFELFIIEVKKHGNYGNGNLEKDLIKLGKEMQLALDKLVLYKVENPEVVGLLVEGIKVTAFKMDLAYNGQYRMVEMSQFFVVRDNVDDIMLIPTIIQKLDQIKQVIEDTNEKIFKTLKVKDCSIDLTSYMRKACGSPVVVKKEQ